MDELNTGVPAARACDSDAVTGDFDAGAGEPDAFTRDADASGVEFEGSEISRGRPAGSGGVPDDFEAALERAIARLPDAYRAQLGTVALVVADEASAEELAELGVRGLYGLYRGIPRTTLAADGMAVPSVITLYRGPLERNHRTPAALQAAVEDTLRHELAHHLGISDRRLDELKGR